MSWPRRFYLLWKFCRKGRRFAAVKSATGNGTPTYRPTLMGPFTDEAKAKVVADELNEIVGARR